MKNIYFPDFSCRRGRMCVYGRYAPTIKHVCHIGEHGPA